MEQIEILSLVEKLIPVYHTTDFESILTRLTEDASPSLKILVKMELNRVMAPCNKPVDLRGRVEGTCYEYDIDGITHWLDDVALNEYQKGVSKYHRYTEGVWEMLYQTYNNLRPSTKNNMSHAKAICPFQVPIIQLGNDLKRQDNHLKYHTQVNVTRSTSQRLVGQSIDLSPSEGKFKLPSFVSYEVGERLKIQFIAFEQRSAVHDLRLSINYQVMAIEDSLDNDAVKIIRAKQLSRTDVITNLIHEQFNTDLKKTRHVHQDLVSRTTTRTYEHIFLQHTNQLPLFFQGHTLKIVLRTENNHAMWRYWHDERNQQSLSHVLTADRLAQFDFESSEPQPQIIYSFTHEHQERVLFFSMTEHEGNDAQRQLFFHIGARKTSWRVHRLVLFKLQAEDREKLITESPELKDTLSLLDHYGFLQEIADPSSAEDYLQGDKPNIPNAEINIFHHSRKMIPDIASIFFDARPQRKDPRYRLISPVSIRLGNNQSIRGETIDFSRRGLSIQLSTATSLKVEDRVIIDYLEIKQYNRKLPLQCVPYVITRVSPPDKTIQLEIEDSKDTIRIVSFLNKLIHTNLDKLTEKKEVIPSLGLLEELHNILLSHIYCVPFYVERKGINLEPVMVGIQSPLPRFLVILGKLGCPGMITLDPILKGHTNTLLSQPMQHIERDTPEYNEIYLAVRKFGHRIHSTEAKMIGDFSSPRERIDFIQDALLMGEIFVLRILSAPIFNPINSLLQEELDGLSSISMFHARKIEKVVQSLVGYGEIIDITAHVLNRLSLEPH